MKNDQPPPSTTHETDDTAVRSRRRALAVLAVAPAFAACALGTVELPADNQDPENEGGASDDTGDPTQPPPGDDSGVPTTNDTGSPTTAPHDSGTATTPAKDSGTTTAPDTGTPGTCTPTGTNAGVASSWSVGTWKKVGNSFVGRDAKGFYALSSICTHNNSCGLRTPTSTGISCPCHGGQFDLNGNVTRIPPPTPLRNFKVSVCNGNVYVDTTKTVAQGIRAN